MKWAARYSQFWRTMAFVCDDPQAMITDSGDVRLNGTYTIDQLIEIVDFAKSRLTPHPADRAGAPGSEVESDTRAAADV